MKIYRVLLCACLLFSAAAMAQDKDEAVYRFAQKMPAPGYDLKYYLDSGLHYPLQAWLDRTEGNVVVKFIVNEDGHISNAEIVRGLSAECDSEAIRVLQAMPAWDAGMQSGKAVKVYCTRPIPFIRIFTYADRMPNPPYDLSKYFKHNLHYPVAARDKNIEGRVLVKFVVNEDGHLSDAHVIKRLGYDCDEEALSVLQNMPKWNAGMQDGDKVKCYVTLPVFFKLSD